MQLMSVACRGQPAAVVPASHLLDFSLQVSQLDALLQVAAVLLCCQVQLLLLLVKELQQVLDPCGHVHVPITQQLHTWRGTDGHKNNPNINNNLKRQTKKVLTNSYARLVFKKHIYLHGDALWLMRDITIPRVLSQETY